MKFNNNSGAQKRITNAVWSILLLVFTITASSQAKMISSAIQQNDDAMHAKAERVLQQAREATRKDLKAVEIKGLIVGSKSDGTYTLGERNVPPTLRNKKFQETSDEELSVSLPDKIRYKINADHTAN